MQRNILVCSSLRGSDTANRFMQITRWQHVRDRTRPRTLTVMFQDPPEELHEEAWRILRAVVKGKELLPEHVHEYMTESLARHSAARPLADLKLLPWQLSLPGLYWLVGHFL